MTIGAMIIPSTAPSLIQDLLRGDNNFELTKPSIKKIPEIEIK